MKYLFCLIWFVVLAFSCGSVTDNNQAVNDTVYTQNDRASEPGEDISATVETTVSAVKSGNGKVTGVAPQVAVSVINTFIEQMDDVAGANKITGNLEVLRDELKSESINGPLVGMLFVTLAEDARQVAGNKGGYAFSTLVSSLRSEGDELTAGIVSGSDLLSQTLNVIKAKAADITTLPVASAVGNIDSWISKLEAMPGTTEMTTELRALRMELGKPNINGNRVAGHLKSLSEQTGEMADGNAALEVLAYALEAGYWNLK